MCICPNSWIITVLNTLAASEESLLQIKLTSLVISWYLTPPLTLNKASKEYSHRQALYELDSQLRFLEWWVEMDSMSLIIYLYSKL